MTDAKQNVQDLWSSLEEKAKQDKDVMALLDHLDELEKKLDAVGDQKKEQTFRLPYSGAEPLTESAWK